MGMNTVRIARRAIELSGVIAVMLAAAEARAQIAAPAAADPAATPLGVQDIVVTARRREERLQSVPVAITALTTADLAQRQIADVGDLARNAVGLQFVPSVQGNSLPAFTIRSQRQSSPIITNDPSVMIYFNEVVQARPHGVNASLFDVSSVQVLKGPQGTLFGRNSTGGAILISAQAPTDKLEGYVRGTLGNYDAHSLEAVLNIPLSKMLQLRVGGNLRRHDGYIDAPNVPGNIDNERTEAWRVSLRFVPSDNITNDLVVNGFHENDAGAAYKLTYVRPGGLSALLYPTLAAEAASLANKPFFYSPIAGDPHGTKVRTLNISNITRLDLGPVTFKNIFGYRDINSRATFTLDGSSQSVFPNIETLSSHQYSDEFQILGKALADTLDYIVGLYYFRETGHDRQLSIPFRSVNDVNANARNVGKSAFGQVTWRPQFLRGVSVTAGARQTHDFRGIDQRSFTNGVCRLVDADVGGVPLNPCFRAANVSYDRFTYTLGADWKVSNRALLYFTHRKGYRSGGFNFSANSPLEIRPYAPEIVYDYEVGLKTDWRLGGTSGRLNIAAYHQNYQNIQRQTQAQAGSTRASIINAASAKIDGAEVELTWLPVRELELFAGYARSNPRYQRFVTPAGVDMSNSAFAGAPKNSLNAHVRLTLPVDADGGDVSAQLSYYYQSSTVGSDTNNFDTATGKLLPSSIVPSYHTIDARLEWSRPFGRKGVSIALYGRNLSNEKYFTSIFDGNASLGFTSALLGSPRTYGVDLRVGF